MIILLEGSIVGETAIIDSKDIIILDCKIVQILCCRSLFSMISA